MNVLREYDHCLFSTYICMLILSSNSRPAVLSEEEDLDDHSSTIDESDEISSISSSDSLDDFSDFGEGCVASS